MKKTTFFIILISAFFLISCSETSSKNEKFSEEGKEYFIEIALGSEFNTTNKVIMKRYTDIKIYVEGEKPNYLMEELKLIIDELNALIRFIKLELVEYKSNSNFVIFFGSGKDYAEKIESNAKKYIDDNWALFFVNINSSFDIIGGSMYVDIYKTQSEKTQKHLLREELTQSIGLMNDSDKYKDSIFYDAWTETNYYTEIDKEIIKILYSDNIISGMNEEQLRKALQKM